MFSYSFILPPLSLQRGHGEDSAPLLLAQLLADDAVDAGADGVARLVDENAGVVVEANNAAVAARHPLLGPHDDGLADVAALDLGRRRGGRHALGGGASLLLHDADNLVTCGGVSVVAG